MGNLQVQDGRNLFNFPEQDEDVFLETFVKDYNVLDENMLRQDSVFGASADLLKRDASVEESAGTWLNKSSINGAARESPQNNTANKGSSLSNQQRESNRLSESTPSLFASNQGASGYPTGVVQQNFFSTNLDQDKVKNVQQQDKRGQYDVQDNEIARYFDSMDTGVPKGVPIQDLNQQQSSGSDNNSSLSGQFPHGLGLSPLDNSKSFTQIAGLDPDFSGRNDFTKNESLLEKNRKAQKRFRSKQKERMQGLEVQVLQLRDQIQSLYIQNEDIKIRKATLESIIKYRDTMTSFNPEKKEIFKKSENKILKDSFVKLLNDFGLPEQENAARCQDAYGNQCCAYKLKYMNQKEVIGIFREWVAIFTQALQDMQDPNKVQEAQETINREIRSLAIFMCWLSLYNYQAIVRLMLYNMDTNQINQTVEDEARQKILKNMESAGIQPKTIEQLATYYQCRLEKKEELSQQLQDITDKLQETLQHGLQHRVEFNGQKSNGTSLVDDDFLIEEVAEFYEATTRFKEKSWLIHILHQGVYGTVLFQILTPEQTARLFVNSFPEFPNVSGLMYIAHSLQPELKQRNLDELHNSYIQKGYISELEYTQSEVEAT